MLDGFLSGIIGGYIIPKIAPFFRRFKYITIFLVSFIITYFSLFIAGVPSKGWRLAAQTIVTDDLPLAALLSAGMGLGAAFLVWLYSIGMSNKGKG